MKFIIKIYTTNKLTVVEMEDIRGMRLRKFNLRKIVLGIRMHFHHIHSIPIDKKFQNNSCTTKMCPAMQYCDVITNPRWRTAAI